MKKGTLVILTLALFAWACEKGWEGPSSPTSEGTGTPLAGVTPGSSNPTNPTVDTPAPTGCDLVQLNRASIKSETHCEKGVRFYAGANVTQGTGYFNVHIGGLNSGTVLGPNELNEWSKWYDLDKGSYTYTLAAETKVEGKVHQCDHHNHKFTISDCPGCVQPPAPPCEFGPAIYNAEDCTYQCPPCVMPPKPECAFGEAKPDGCGWKCPPCMLDDPPKCEHGPAIPDFKLCKWHCPPCVLPPPPVCEFGDPTPHPVVCSWVCPPCEACVDSSESLMCKFNETTHKVVCKAMVSHQGRIVMKQSGSPILTEDFTGSRAFMSPVLACDETPVNVMLMNRDNICGPREKCGQETTTVIPFMECLPTEHLHPDECKCYCNPVAETRECDEQQWNEILCIWEGECPCLPLECEFGYRWSEDKCECVKRNVCHVSNGGQPGECDWNLQEQNKKYTPGHGRHMNPDNQCPPDYFGKCDGRYETNPHACQLACQPK